MALLEDTLQPFEIEGLHIRGRLVRLGTTFKTTQEAHAYPDFIGEQVGEAMALSAILAGALKYDGLFTLQIQSDGIISLLVNDVTSEGYMRGYTRFDENAEPTRGLFGKGHLAFTVDQGAHMERYQGIVELAGDSLADSAQEYFKRSEQLETAIILVSQVGDNAGAAGLMIQRMPEAVSETQVFDAVDESEENWNRVQTLMKSVTSKELLDPDLSANDILFRLFHEDGVRVYDPKPLEHRCRCSRQKVESTLQSFKKEEVYDLREDGEIKVSCEFCKTDYLFDEADLEELAFN
ncbi:MAG: Hsp33 family molecular chaperone HslO [Rhodospirillales bacterium]|nr:Hsp33 family molecular chaperone HslO [Rhodospirillales bacterium]